MKKNDEHFEYLLWAISVLPIIKCFYVDSALSSCNKNQFVHFQDTMLKILNNLLKFGQHFPFIYYFISSPQNIPILFIFLFFRHSVHPIPWPFSAFILRRKGRLNHLLLVFMFNGTCYHIKMEIQTTVKKIREIDFTKNQVDMPQQQWKKLWLWFHEKSSRTSCQYIRMEILAAMVQARLINMRKSPPVAASAGVILPRVHLGEVAWKNSLSRINSFGWKKWIFIKIMIAMKAILRYVVLM